MQRLETVQIIRGVAATLVVTIHMVDGVRAEGFSWPMGEFLFRNGAIGVDIFFVISGFIIYFIGMRDKPPTARAFLWNRFWRVVPPYWVVTLVLVAMSVGLWLVIGETNRLPSVSKVIYSLLLYPMLPGEYVLVIAWTLTLELIFYAVFASTALRHGAGAFFAAMGVWYILATVFWFVSEDLSGWRVSALNPVIMEFIFGALIARWYLAGKTAFHLPVFILGIVGLGVVMLTHADPTPWMRREFLYGLPAACLIYGAIGLPWRWPPILLLWGESSYILYLAHIPAFLLVGRGIEEVTGYNVYSHPISAMGMILLVVMLSMGLTVLCERPYQRFYKRRFLTK